LAPCRVSREDDLGRGLRWTSWASSPRLVVGVVAVVTAIRQNGAEDRERTALKERLRDDEEE